MRRRKTLSHKIGRYLAAKIFTLATQFSDPIHHTCCPACGSRKIQHQLEARDHTVSGENFGIWSCTECSLRFTQDIPDAQHIGQYYQSESYISHTNTRKGLVNTLYHWVRRYTLGSKRRLLVNLSGKSSGKLLDYGCGTGAFAATMQQAGWQVLGLEPDAGARAQASLAGVDNGAPEMLFELDAASFDVITLWHVLEHVHRLHDVVQALVRALKPDGLLLIAVPNYSALDAAHYGEHWAAWDVPRHLYHFSPDAMQRLLSKHGLSMVQQRAMPFDAFYVSMLSEKYRHGRLRLMAAAWTGFRSWWRAMGHPDRSSSVIYILRPEKKF